MQFKPAYRLENFANRTVKTLTRDNILAAAIEHKITVSAIGFGPDHCHVFTEQCKTFGISK